MITTNYAGNAFSQDFIDAVNAQMVEYDAKLYDNGSPVDCSIMRMTLTLGGCSESDEGFQIGEVYASSLAATLHGLASSLTGHELDVLIGVNTGSAYEYAQVATVVVTSSKAKGGFVSIQAAGKLAYACTNVPIGTSGELTTAEVAAAILAASGIPVTIGQFASTTTVTITADMTCRAALAATAKRLGGYACETNAGGAAIMPFSATSTYTLDPEDMTRYPDLEESDYTVDGITVQAAEDAYTFGTGRVVIADANATATTAAVTWGNVSGYSFRQGSANTAILDPRVTPFDVLTIGNATMPARGISATYDGGYFGVFSALGLTDAGEAAHFKGAIAEQVDAAERAANEAKSVAEATGQHFWPYDDGAHVTGPETEDEFLAAQAAGFPDLSNSKPYHNLLMNSLGILLRSALNNLVSITRSAIAFFDGNGNGSGNIIASFGAGGAQLGKSGSAHFTMDASSLAAYDSTAAKYFEVSASGMTFGSNTAATTAQVTEAVDAIQVGGRNFLLDTGSMDTWGKNNGTTISGGVVTFPAVTSATWREAWPVNVLPYSLVRNSDMVFSCKVKAASGAACKINLCVGVCANATSGGNRQKYHNIGVDFTGTGSWETVYTKFKLTDSLFDGGSGSPDFDTCYITARPGTWNTSLGSFSAKEFKLETGNKPTDWSPAPEDVDAAVDDAAKTATNYISADSSGIRIANADPATATTYQHQTATNTEFVVDDASMAKIGGDGIRLGETSSSHLDGDYHSLQLVDKDGNTYFHVSDLRDQNGIATIVEKFEGDGTTTDFQLQLHVKASVSVTVNGAQTQAFTITLADKLRFTAAPADGAEIAITYTTESEYAKAYTLGTRLSGSNVGGMSHAEGRNVTSSAYLSHAEGLDSVASGNESHAEGRGCEASGACSHAEGCQTVASGVYSHAEGLRSAASGPFAHAEGMDTAAGNEYSHAEGVYSEATGLAAHAEGYQTHATGERSHAEGWSTRAEGKYSHAEGNQTKAEGQGSHAEGSATYAYANNSHAQNLGTEAGSANQTVLGKYNRADYNDTYALIIGNGTGNSSRSNALTVDWSGNVVAAGDIAAPLMSANWTPVAAYTSSTLTVKRFGHVVYITGMVSITTAITTRTKIATIPAGFRPAAQSYGRTNDSGGGVLTIANGNGDFSIDPIAAGNHWFSMIWMTA